jgi:U3 small nucleolar RNA-associated protein 5
VSIAEDDRYVNVWDAQSSNTNSNNLTALTLENNVAHVNFSSTEPSVLAVTEDGLVGIWENASSISQASGGSSRRKMMRSMTKEADATLKIVSTVSQDTIVPVLAAKFVADNSGKSIMIARGSSIKPSFEVVKYVNDENGAILRDIELTRQPITNYLIDDGSVAASNLRTTRKAYDESKVTVIGNTDFAVKTPTMAATTETQDDSNAEPSIEQRLKDMGVGENTTSKARKSKKKTIATPAAGSLQNVLVQALHSHDKQLLEACLEHTKLDVIHGTIKRLPTQYLIPLLTELISKFQEKPGRASSLLDWIKAVLTIHTAYLMTVPDLVGKLSSFYQALDTRYSVFPKLLALSGRLDIVQNQINVRSYSTLNQDELEMAHHAENVYVELDSDDEDEAEELMSIHGGDDMMDTSDDEMVNK